MSYDGKSHRAKTTLAPQRTTKDLVFALFWSLRWDMLAPVWPRVAMIAFTYCQPLLISRVLDFQEEPRTPESKNIGYGLIAAYGFVYIGLAVSLHRRSYKFSHTDKT